MDSTNKQPLRLLQAEPSDALEILELNIASFSDPYQPGFFVLYPKEEKREKGAKRMLDLWLSDPTAIYMKVVDTETGKIISAAQWCIHKEPTAELAPVSQEMHFNCHPNADLNNWGEEMWSFVHQEQLARLKDGGCCIIEMLATHPEHRCRGAGTMLMEWGTNIADSLRLRAFVQASDLGAKLYGSHGFVDRYNEGFVTVPVSEKHKNKPEIGWFNLERPAKAGGKIPEAKEGV
ncbi:hypothetical protein N431DRAFT_476098 [Stipitochalara longipes BDJ]|nr:hypothetical protein N431DRAFT_476098 [Stipitochalara longipes BDJ]